MNLLLRAFGINDKPAPNMKPCPTCGQPRWTAPERSAVDRYLRGEISVERLETLLEEHVTEEEARSF